MLNFKTYSNSIVDTGTVICLIGSLHLFLSNLNRRSLNYLKIALVFVDLGPEWYNNLGVTKISVVTSQLGDSSAAGISQ